MAPLKRWFNRVVIDFYKYGNEFAGLTLPCLIQATSEGGGFFGYGISTCPITRDFINVSIVHSYLVSAMRLNDMLSFTHSKYSELISSVGREVFAYDRCDIEFYSAFGILIGNQIVADFAPDYPLWNMDRGPGQPASEAKKAEPGANGWAGADWYAIDYDTFNRHNSNLTANSFGDPLKIRPCTNELLSWEMGTSINTYNNGNLKRYPQINLTKISIDLYWSPAVVEYVNAHGRNAWITYSLYSTYGRNSTTCMQVRSVNPGNAYQLNRIVVDMSSRAPQFRLWDTKAMEDNPGISVTTPYIIIYVLTADPEKLAREKYGKPYSALTREETFSILRENTFAVHFTGIPMQV